MITLKVETQLKGYTVYIFMSPKRYQSIFFCSSYLKTNFLAIEGKSNKSVRSLWTCSNRQLFSHFSVIVNRTYM